MISESVVLEIEIYIFCPLSRQVNVGSKEESKDFKECSPNTQQGIMTFAMDGSQVVALS